MPPRQQVRLTRRLPAASLHEDEVDGEDEAGEGGEVVPLQGFAFEEDDGEYCEDNEGDGFLNDFQLHKGEESTVALETDAVGRHLKAVFSQSYAPREENDGIEGCVRRYELHLL